MAIRNPEAPGWPDRGERTEDEEIADQWKWAYYALMRDGHRRRVMGLGPPPRPIGKAIEQFLEHRRNTVEKATWGVSRTACGHLARHFGTTLRTDQITGAALQELVEEMLEEGYEPSTLKTNARTWRLFLEWCYFGVSGLALREGTSRRRLKEFYDPTEELSIPDPGQTDVTTLTDEQIPMILAAAAKVDEQQIGLFPSAVLACGIGIFMGLRQGEIFALSWQDIDSANRTARPQLQVPKDSLELKPLKGKRARTALVLPGWWEHHRRDAVGFVCGRTGKPVGTRTQRNLVTRVLDTAGLNELGRGWHLFRHTYARRFIEQGGRLEELQKGLGHSSFRTTESIYGHFHHDVAARLARERIYGA